MGGHPDRRWGRALACLVVVLLPAGCQAGAAVSRPPGRVPAGTVTPPPPPSPTPTPSPQEGPGPPFLDAATPGAAPAVPAPPASVSVPSRPWWLGTRPLALNPDGTGVVGDTPAELRDRRLPPGAPLPVPDGEVFTATIERVPDEIAARSTWNPSCPVPLDELRYVRLPYWGFDDRPHGGELLVNARVAEDLVAVFRVLFESRFPIEDMRIVAGPDVTAPPTGDGNNTTAFVCRSAVGSSRWSEHAYGLAVDINPFHNPYVAGTSLIPELSGAYTDRSWRRPGMVVAGDEVTEAFALIGWGWGGEWNSSKDWMHFSATGR